MGRNIRYLIIAGAIVCAILSIYTSSVVAADPTITVSPEEPTRKSTVTFTAEFDSDDIQSVYFNYNECTNEACYSLYNKSMTYISDNKFEVEITLLKDDATYVQYWLEFKSADGWSKSEVEKTYLLTGSSGDSNDTPGFEFLLVALSIVFLAIIFKRKRMK
jgi:hypothetical protein